MESAGYQSMKPFSQESEQVSRCESEKVGVPLSHLPTFPPAHFPTRPPALLTWLFALAVAAATVLIAQRAPQDIPDLQRTDEIVLRATVSSAFTTNYHAVELWTNETVTTVASFSSIFEPPAPTTAHLEGLRKERTREIKEIPTLRFSWMGQEHTITVTNVFLSETNHEVLRYIDGEKTWKWLPERADKR